MKLDCPIARATPFLGSKWTLELIYYLQERRRFCELQEIMGGVNPATLSQRLKTLEAEEIIYRQVVPDAQRHVEYELTSKGRDLLSVFQELIEWVGRWYPEETI
jgi:DNA-binding HxlR family transcriptional regulator